MFKIGNVFKFIPISENSFYDSRVFNFKSGFIIFSVDAFESILSAKRFLNVPHELDLQNESKQLWSSFKHFPAFSSYSELKSRAYNIAFAKYRAGQ